MSSSKWKDGAIAQIVLAQIADLEIKDGQQSATGVIHTHKNHKRSFSRDFSTEIEILVFNVRFSEEIPAMKRKEIVKESILLAADAQSLEPARVSEYIKSLEKIYRETPLEEFVFISRISILHTKKFKPVEINGARIKFLKNPPRTFDLTEIEYQANLLADSSGLAHFTYVKVEIRSRCEESAYESAKKSLDFLFGIWNFVINLKAGSRRTFGIPERVSKIIYGPCHSIHRSDGSRASTRFWYENHIRRHLNFCDIESEFESIRKHERKIRRTVKQYPMERLLEKSFIKYFNALQDEDMTTSYIKLWSLLEHITCTEKDTYEVTIRRASQIYINKDILMARLNMLREKRNSIIHSSNNHSTENDVYALLEIVHTCMRFALSFSKKISSLDTYKNFLDLPHSKLSEQEELRRILRKLKTHQLINTIQIYG